MFCPPKWKYETRFDNAYEISSKGILIAYCFANEDDAKLISHAPELFELLELVLTDDTSTLNPALRNKAIVLFQDIIGGDYKL